MKSAFLVIATSLVSIAGKTVASNPLTSPSITSLLPTSLIFLGFQLATATADSDATIAEIREAVFAEDTAQDEVEQCDFWAENGECSHNPRYMLENCGNACRRQERIDREIGRLIDSKISHIESFFQLKAEDIDGKTISFEQFRGKVTVITNVASYCGYTESHYRGLVDLYDKFKDSAVGFNILAFPCNQFGQQEPNSCSEIKRFVENKGVEFTMMNKIDVNGMDAHDVYHYLKKVAGPPRITWNFATYYIVTPGGVVSSYSGVEPMELSNAIVEAMKEAGAESDEL